MSCLCNHISCITYHLETTDQPHSKFYLHKLIFQHFWSLLTSHLYSPLFSWHLSCETRHAYMENITDAHITIVMTNSFSSTTQAISHQFKYSFMLTKHFDHDKLNNTSIIYFNTICNEYHINSSRKSWILQRHHENVVVACLSAEELHTPPGCLQDKLHLLKINQMTQRKSHLGCAARIFQ